MDYVTFFLVSALTFVGRVEAGIFCYNCDSLPHQRDCDKIVKCGDHEECFGEHKVTVDGISLFTSGCKPRQTCIDSTELAPSLLGKRSDITACSKCCNNSYCNRELCDQHVPVSGIRCLSCKYALTPSECFVSVQCNTGEICYSQSIIHNGEKRFRLGCINKQQCESFPTLAIGKRDVQTDGYCGQCCSESNCNHELCSNSSQTFLPLVHPPVLSICRDNDTDFCLSHTSRCNENIFKYFLCSYTCGQCGVQVIDFCLSNPCGSNGVCNRVTSGYTCSCSKGYAGVNCETDICSSQPCQNSGRCHNREGRYVCNCHHGYTGSNCEKDINECESNPCLHNGTCHDKPNHFYCSCLPGYNGTHCENAVNPCASNPCLHGGKCVNHLGTFRCDCIDFNKGDRCETECAKERNYVRNSHCYFLTYQKTNWASNICKRNNMHYAVFGSEGENRELSKFLSGILPRDEIVWLGANYSHSNHHWTWINNELIKMSDNHWETSASTSPKGDKSHYCVAMHGDKWNTVDCSHDHYHLCERRLQRLTSDTTTLISNNNTCSGKFSEGRSCYFLIRSKGHWTEDPCRKVNMRLATVNSDREHNAIVKYVRTNSTYSGHVWLGGQSTNQHSWMWKDEHQHAIPLDSNNWKVAPKPQDHGCVSLKNDKWDTENCGTELFYLCESRF